MKKLVLAASTMFATFACVLPASAVTEYSITDLGTLVGPTGDSYPRRPQRQWASCWVFRKHRLPLQRRHDDQPWNSLRHSIRQRRAGH